MNRIKSFFNSVVIESNSEPIAKTLENMTSSLKSMPSVLSKDLEVEGDIKSSGTLEIEGKVKGIISSSSIVIREGGTVEGTVNAESINIRGKFTGDIKAKTISIFKKATITGNIEYVSLSIEDGACVDGQFKHLGNQKNQTKKLTTSASEEELFLGSGS